MARSQLQTFGMDLATERSPHAIAGPCYHCGEEIPDGTHYGVDIEGEFRAMCCPGCTAVARLISGSGLDSFYRQRTAYSERPDEQDKQLEDYRVYNDVQLRASFVTENADGLSNAALLIGGMNCAACTWLIEQSVSTLPGVQSACVNLQQSRLDVEYDPNICNPSDLMCSTARLGYQPRPWQASALRDQLASESRVDLRRLAVAGIGMMQVGMFAIALHAGDIQGIDERYQGLLRWVSLPVTLFVLLYSAQPFFIAAWRHLRQGSLVMDLPVALAISIATIASAWATFTSTGQVYFDSVVMFTFLLLLARYLEKRVRARQNLDWAEVQDCLPAAVRVLHDGDWQQVPRMHLRAGDRFMVRPGETIALDGTVKLGSSAVSETAFNGEELPRSVAALDTVYAGSVNIEQALEITARCESSQTRLAALQGSLTSATAAKPHIAAVADRVASWFVGGILLATSATALVWWQLDPSRALWVALSVLVISCPCALAIATPTALASAATALRRRGVIVHGANAVQALAKTTDIVFDKTGTLTRGELAIDSCVSLGVLNERELMSLAAALQQYSTHPVANAFKDTATQHQPTQIQATPGAGICAVIEQIEYRIGSRSFCDTLTPMPEPPDEQLYWVGLCRNDEALAWFGLRDCVRAEAADLVKQCKMNHMTVHMLTGDASTLGPRLAAELGIQEVQIGQTPQQKMAYVQKLQSNTDAIVVMVGDGLNDAPVLRVANASFAVAGATDLARTQADFVICDGDLNQIQYTWRMARQSRRVIMQNLCWALGYNLCAIPLAAMGYVPPWAAALGMSASSLLVIANSLRLTKLR